MFVSVFFKDKTNFCLWEPHTFISIFKEHLNPLRIKYIVSASFTVFSKSVLVMNSMILVWTLSSLILSYTLGFPILIFIIIYCCSYVSMSVMNHLNSISILMDMTMLIYLVLSLVFGSCCCRASMDLLLLINTQTYCCQRMRYATAA